MPVQKRIILESGKRKTAIARAKLQEGSGGFRVNNIPVDLVQPEVARWVMKEPLLLADPSVLKGVQIDVDVRGGGFMGQAEAVRMAVARGLVKWTRSATLRKRFREHDRTMLAGDARAKESKKFGGRGARKRRQKSYR
ncbi:MAG: 30S ribosomal protein S9 [Candidatus Bathyarchaeia archaeon]